MELRMITVVDEAPRADADNLADEEMWESLEEMVLEDVVLELPIPSDEQMKLRLATLQDPLLIREASSERNSPQARQAEDPGGRTRRQQSRDTADTSRQPGEESNRAEQMMGGEHGSRLTTPRQMVGKANMVG